MRKDNRVEYFKQYREMNKISIKEKQEVWNKENPNYHKIWRENNIHKILFVRKRSDAKRKNIEFTLLFDDIIFPTHCPVLGIRLDYGTDKKGKPQSNSPSFDRINPNQGYVKDNVIIISNRANVIKSNASVAEIKAVAKFYERILKK